MNAIKHPMEDTVLRAIALAAIEAYKLEYLKANRSSTKQHIKDCKDAAALDVLNKHLSQVDKEIAKVGKSAEDTEAEAKGLLGTFGIFPRNTGLPSGLRFNNN